MTALLTRKRPPCARTPAAANVLVAATAARPPARVRAQPGVDPSKSLVVGTGGPAHRTLATALGYSAV